MIEKLLRFKDSRFKGLGFLFLKKNNEVRTLERKQ
jgi:hypothetical protein